MEMIEIIKKTPLKFLLSPSFKRLAGATEPSLRQPKMKPYDLFQRVDLRMFMPSPGLSLPDFGDPVPATSLYPLLKLLNFKKADRRLLKQILKKDILEAQRVYMTPALQIELSTLMSNMATTIQKFKLIEKAPDKLKEIILLFKASAASDCGQNIAGHLSGAYIEILSLALSVGAADKEAPSTSESTQELVKIAMAVALDSAISNTLLEFSQLVPGKDPGVDQHYRAFVKNCGAEAFGMKALLGAQDTISDTFMKPARKFEQHAFQVAIREKIVTGGAFFDSLQNIVNTETLRPFFLRQLFEAVKRYVESDSPIAAKLVKEDGVSRFKRSEEEDDYDDAEIQAYLTECGYLQETNTIIGEQVKHEVKITPCAIALVLSSLSLIQTAQPSRLDPRVKSGLSEIAVAVSRFHAGMLMKDEAKMSSALSETSPYDWAYYLCHESLLCNGAGAWVYLNPLIVLHESKQFSAIHAIAKRILEDSDTPSQSSALTCLNTFIDQNPNRGKTFLEIFASQDSYGILVNYFDHAITMAKQKDENRRPVQLLLKSIIDVLMKNRFFSTVEKLLDLNSDFFAVDSLVSVPEFLSSMRGFESVTKDSVMISAASLAKKLRCEDQFAQVLAQVAFTADNTFLYTFLHNASLLESVGRETPMDLAFKHSAAKCIIMMAEKMPEASVGALIVRALREVKPEILQRLLEFSSSKFPGLYRSLLPDSSEDGLAEHLEAFVCQKPVQDILRQLEDRKLKSKAREEMLAIKEKLEADHLACAKILFSQQNPLPSSNELQTLARTALEHRNYACFKEIVACMALSQQTTWIEKAVMVIVERDDFPSMQLLLTEDPSIPTFPTHYARFSALLCAFDAPKSAMRATIHDICEHKASSKKSPDKELLFMNSLANILLNTSLLEIRSCVTSALTWIVKHYSKTPALMERLIQHFFKAISKPLCESSKDPIHATAFAVAVITFASNLGCRTALTSVYSAFDSLDQRRFPFKMSSLYAIYLQRLEQQDSDVSEVDKSSTAVGLDVFAKNKDLRSKTRHAGTPLASSTDVVL